MKKMSKLVKYFEFIDNGSIKREKENFKYHLFKNFDFKHKNKPISFFRSDFRGAKFIDIIFYENNFDRADFIDASIFNSYFLKTNIGMSELKNCFIKDTEFKENIYKTTSIQGCVFINCKFISEKFLINMHNCEFINCEFIRCNFERSTIEEVLFNSCDIIECDLATMHAENLSFNECMLDEVFFGRDYWCSYLFKETSLNSINLKYRGKITSVKEDRALFKEYFIELYKTSRFFEFINAKIIFNSIKGNKKSIFPILKNILYLLNKDKFNITRKKKFLKIWHYPGIKPFVSAP